MCVGYFRRCDDIFHGRVLYTESDIVEDGVIEQDRLLVHIAHQASEAVDLDVADVSAVDFYRAAGHVVESRDEIDQCGFARAGFTDDSHGAALLYGKIDVVKYLSVSIIGE